MEQQLRFVSAPDTSSSIGDRSIVGPRRVAVPGQIVWRDARGTTRIVSVGVREVTDQSISVDCYGGSPIPLFRLVHFQVDRSRRTHMDLPECLQKAGVLCAVTRVGPCGQATGSPSDYELRLLIEPRREAPVAGTVGSTRRGTG